MLVLTHSGWPGHHHLSRSEKLVSEPIARPHDTQNVLVGGPGLLVHDGLVDRRVEPLAGLSEALDVYLAQGLQKAFAGERNAPRPGMLRQFARV